MANNAKAAIFAAISEMTLDMSPSWDAPSNWASTTDALVDLIAAIGGKVTPDQFSTLVATAAMTLQQWQESASVEAAND